MVIQHSNFSNSSRILKLKNGFLLHSQNHHVLATDANLGSVDIGATARMRPKPDSQHKFLFLQPQVHIRPKLSGVSVLRMTRRNISILGIDAHQERRR